MPRYFAAGDGGYMEVGDSPLAESHVPDGWEEVTAARYQEVRDAARRVVADAAAAFIAADGAVPVAEGVTVPLARLGQEVSAT